MSDGGSAFIQVAAGFHPAARGWAGELTGSPTWAQATPTPKLYPKWFIPQRNIRANPFIQVRSSYS